MPISFSCATTAAVHQELEYVSALLQTNKDSLRVDGSVTARDIRRYLASRHSLRVSVKDVETMILQDLAGTVLVNNDADDDDGDDPPSLMPDPCGKDSVKVKKINQEENKFDLVQLTSLLLLPILRQIEYHYEQQEQQKTNRSPEMEISFGGKESAPEQEPSMSKSRPEDSDEETTTDTWNLMDTVLLLILQEVGLDYGVELNDQTLKKILSAFGERWPAHVRAKMIQQVAVASQSEGGDTSVPRLNNDTFRKVLTSDILYYDVTKVDSLSTFYEDALQSGPTQNLTSRSTGSGGRIYSPHVALQRFYTAPNVDSAVNPYFSFLWNILTWLTMSVTFFWYLFQGVTPETGFMSVDCSKNQTFGCFVASSILTWLEIFIKLGTLGFLFLYLSTLGNNVYISYRRHKALGVVGNLVGMVTILFFIVFPYHYQWSWEMYDASRESDQNIFLAPISLALGVLLLVVQVFQLVRLLLPDGQYEKIKFVFLPGVIKCERNLKRAAACKVFRMIDDALRCHVDYENAEAEVIQTQSIHDSIRSSLLSRVADQGLKTYSPSFEAMVQRQKRLLNSDGQYSQNFGGIRWTWRKIWDGTLFKEEGFWLFPRLVSSNLIQWIVVLAFAALTYFGLAFIGGVNLEDVYVSKFQLQLSFLVGAIPAFLGAFNTAFVYIPSAVASVFRFRTGVFGTLKERTFLQNRYALDTVNLLFGASFWAPIASGLSIWLVIFVIVFLLSWKHPEYSILVNRVVADLIGVTVTLVVKIIILQSIRWNCYGGFFRRRPLVINLINTVDEAWNLGLTTWTIVLRLVRILAVALFYIGRIDTPLFGPGVGWLFNKFPADTLPIIFQKDLLIHEAHRHPYIERIGFLYLLKLRHGNAFGSQEGAAWRILFTLALMPWLRKYRIHSYEEPVEPLQETPQTMSASSDVFLQNTILLKEVEKLKKENSEMKKLLGDNDVPLSGMLDNEELGIEPHDDRLNENADGSNPGPVTQFLGTLFRS